MESWYVYIVRCRDGTLYTGIAIDVEKRIDKHNSGLGAKYTRSRCPVKLVMTEKCKSENEARKREAEIKGWTRIEKDNFINLVKKPKYESRP